MTTKLKFKNSDNRTEGTQLENFQSVLLLNIPQCFVECGGQLDDGDRTRYCAIGDTILMSGRNTVKYVNEILCIK